MSRRVAVVIPSWNSRQLLERCLESVFPQVRSRKDVIVVDNGSADGSPDLLGRMGLRCIGLSKNIGFAAAVNRGAAATDAEFVFVLNADTELAAGCIEKLATALVGDVRLGGVQPRLLQLGSEPPRIYSAGQELGGDGRARERGAGELDCPRFRQAMEVFGVCGAACLLRRELFDRLGGFDERYFAFHEDVDLNARARLAGWRFAYEPDAVVLHAGSAVWTTVAPEPLRFNTRLMARNRLATSVKIMPLSHGPHVVAAEIGALLRSVRRRALMAAVRGRVEAIFWLPWLLRERRALRREGDPALLRPWLS